MKSCTDCFQLMSSHREAGYPGVPPRCREHRSPLDLIPTWVDSTWGKERLKALDLLEVNGPRHSEGCDSCELGFPCFDYIGYYDENGIGVKV